MASELSPGTISSILEAVPGIASVLRSPVADAMVHLTRAAAGLAPFDVREARELIRYAVRRGLIGSEEGDRLQVEVEGAAAAKAAKAAARRAARDSRLKGRKRAPSAAQRAHKPAARKAAARRVRAAKPARRSATKRTAARKVKKRR